MQPRLPGAQHHIYDESSWHRALRMFGEKQGVLNRKVERNKGTLALVGPVSPFRGGIAQYTTCLMSAFDSRTTRVLSFHRLYPAWLYPGASDREAGATPLPGVDYMLNALSPWSWIRAARHLHDQGNRAVVLTWWTAFWAPALALIALLLRRRGVPCYFLCHNLSDHGAKGLKERVMRRLLATASGYIVHSSEHAAQLRARFPDKPVLQRPIPVYDQFPAPISVLPRRGRLELLFFGFIRPYKGLDVLLRALRMLDDSDIHLSIVGEPWEDADALRAQVQAISPNIECRFEYTDEVTAAAYFARTDVVVLPYLSATGSAVAALAYHYGKPVLATRVGGLKDVVLEEQTGWLVEPDDAAALASAIAALSAEHAADMKKGITAFCEENSWEAMARHIQTFVDSQDARS